MSGISLLKVPASVYSSHSLPVFWHRDSLRRLQTLGIAKVCIIKLQFPTKVIPVRWWNWNRWFMRKQAACIFSPRSFEFRMKTCMCNTKVRRKKSRGRYRVICLWSNSYGMVQTKKLHSKYARLNSTEAMREKTVRIRRALPLEWRQYNFLNIHLVKRIDNT